MVFARCAPISPIAEKSYALRMLPSTTMKPGGAAQKDGFPAIADFMMSNSCDGSIGESRPLGELRQGLVLSEGIELGSVRTAALFLFPRQGRATWAQSDDAGGTVIAKVDRDRFWLPGQTRPAAVAAWRLDCRARLSRAHQIPKKPEFLARCAGFTPTFDNALDLSLATCAPD